MPDLPEISQDLDTPLPPGTETMVPYRSARRLPGQAPVVTTGWGARAQPLQPPSQGAAGVPDNGQMVRKAFEQLPVDQAIKAINAAQQFMGQRMFAQAVQKGMPPAQAWLQYGPMMFSGKTLGGSGFAEAINRTVPQQVTEYQKQELARRLASDAAMLALRQRQATLGEAREKRMEQPKSTPAKVVLEPQPGSDEQGTLSGPITDPAIQERLKSRMERATKKGSSEFATNAGNMLRGMFGMPYKTPPVAAPAAAPAVAAPAAPPVPPVPATPPPTAPVTTAPTIDRVRVVGPSGKKGTVPKGTELPEGWKLAE